MREEEIFDETISYSGIFDFEDLYKFIFKYWGDRSHYIRETKNYKDNEKGKIKIIEIASEGKISDYFKFKFKLKIKAPKIEKVLAKKGKKKVRMNKGKISIKMASKILYDYDGNWEKTPVHRFLREIYDKWVIKERVDKHKKMIIEESDEFIRKLKSFLGMKR